MQGAHLGCSAFPPAHNAHCRACQPLSFALQGASTRSQCLTTTSFSPAVSHQHRASQAGPHLLRRLFRCLRNTMRHRAMRGQRAAVPDPHLPPPAPATRQRPVALGCGSLRSGLSFCPHDSLPPQIHSIFGSYCVICVWSVRPVRRVGERGSPRQGSSRQAGSGSSTHQLACGFFWAAFEQTAEFQTRAGGCHHARQVSNPFRIVPPPQPLPRRPPCPAPQLCDQVSDAILDACLEQDPESKVACETATKTNMVGAAGRGRGRMPRFQIRCPSRFLAHVGRRGGAPCPAGPPLALLV